MADWERAELLADMRGPGPYRRLLMKAGTMGRAWPLYHGAERWMFEGGGGRVVVPRAALRLVAGDAAGRTGG
jgi:hypothetical protein